MKKISIVFLLLISSFNISYAQDACKPDGLFPPLVICGKASGNACEAHTAPCNLGHVPVILGNIVIFVITLLLIFVPIYIMYIGILMIVNQGIPKQLAALKMKLVWTIFYLIIIFGSWLIVREIVKVFGISSDVPSFLLDRDGNTLQNPGRSIR